MNVIEITAENPKAKERIRLGAYCRVSSDSNDQLHSFAAQIRHYKDYERRNPQYQLVDIYADEGLTGTTVENRSELQRMISDCEHGKLDRIIVKSVSRLARNTRDLLVALRTFKALGVSVYFEEQDIDTDRINSEMLITFPGMLAQQESESISGNMRWSYKKRMESGEFNCCSPAYGFLMINGKLEINESEAKVVRRIFDLYLQGMGMQRIANLLNAEGVASRYNRQKWYRSTIAYILSNERYMGDALLQKSYTTETLPFKEKKNSGELPQYYVEGSNPAIVSKETFMTARNLLQSRITHSGKERSQYILSGIIQCAECGRHYRRQITRDVAYWICSAKESGASSCTSLRLRENEVYEAFENMLSKLADNREYLLGSLIRQVEKLNHRLRNTNEQIRIINDEISDLASKGLVIARFHSSGILTAAEYATQSAENDNRILELRQKRKLLSSETETDEQLDELNRLNSIVADYIPYSGFREDIFNEIVCRIIVGSHSEISFSLIGGLELSEEICH